MVRGWQADGIIIVKTVQTVIVVEYAAPVQAAEATVHVERYAQDHLISKGYWVSGYNTYNPL